MNVKYLPYQPHCFSFGGFDLQMINTLEAVNEAGQGEIRAERMDIWDRERDFDIVHLWGLEIDHDATVRFAKTAKKKIVVTALLPYFDDILKTGWFYLSSYIDRAKFWKQMIKNIDALVVLNSTQAEIAVRYLKMPRDKVWIIPAIIGNCFFEKEIDNSFIEKYNIPEGYILTTGNICERKNQLNLAKACIKMEQPLVIIGNTLDGNERYGQKLDELIADHPFLYRVNEVAANSGLLKSAYQHCSAFALPSLQEHQPASALEAVITGKAVLMADRKYAREPYFKEASLCDPKSIASIVKGIRSILKLAKIAAPDELTDPFRFNSVGAQYAGLYRCLINS